MNRQQRTIRLTASAGFVVFVCAAAIPAHATVTFTTDTVTRHVFCDMPALKGEFHRNNQRYVASGMCVELEAVQSNDGAKNRSEFDQYNNSKEIWRANWTAEGSYDPTTKVTTETVTLPAPNVTEFAPANRPYGRFTSRMICAADPWLESVANCTAITVTAQGNLGSMEASLRLMKRPFTSRAKEPQRNALIEQQARALKSFDMRPTTAAAQIDRTAAALNAGKSLSSRNVSTEPLPMRSAQTSATLTRPSAALTLVPQAPASAPAAYGVRPPVRDWSKAAPSALGSR